MTDISAGKAYAPLLINIYFSYNCLVSGPTIKSSFLQPSLE